MPNRHPFHLNRSSLLLALISAAFAGQAGAAAGRVDFTVGGATVSGPDGQQRPLAKGAELDSGDTVRTNNGRAQIRFSDGAYVSLQPNTDFSIKEYRFDGKADGSERGFFALAKGAMRAVTGLIGRVNRSRYAITTPTATVGIRGTGGLIAINNDGSTTVTGTSGIWTLTNPAGTLDVPAGTVGTAPANPDQPPKQTDQPPSVGPTPPSPPPTFTQGDQRTSDGSPQIGVVPLVSGSGYAAAVAAGIGQSSGMLQSGVSSIAMFNSAGQLTEITDLGVKGQFFKLDPATGSHADFGTDGILAWGRWIGNVSGIWNCEGPICQFSENYTDQQGLHYVVGMPTVTMPTSGSASYTLLGATRPTFVDGSASPGTFTLNSLFVNFGPTASVNLNFDVKIGADGYRVSAPGTASSAIISFSPSASAIPGFNSCSSGCSASVQGFFAGASAERIGVGYLVSDFFPTFKEASGAAAFKK